METPLSRSAFVRGVGGALAGYLALTSGNVVAQSSVEDRANAALREDDTAKAVAIWEAEYRKWAFDDGVRASLHQVLVIHAYRSLDKGRLAEAKKAAKRAKELIPESPSYDYLDGAFAVYSSTLFSADMYINDPYRAVSESGRASEYVNTQGVLGGSTRALSMSMLEYGRFWYNYVDGIDPKDPVNYVLRMQVNPGYGTGDVVMVFGWEDRDNISAVFLYSTGDWKIRELRNGSWLDAQAVGSMSLSLGQWHALELRLDGTSVEVWMDYQRMARTTMPNLTRGDLGFGVGTPEDSSNYSAVFDDVVVYALK